MSFPEEQSRTSLHIKATKFEIFQCFLILETLKTYPVSAVFVSFKVIKVLKETLGIKMISIFFNVFGADVNDFILCSIKKMFQIISNNLRGLEDL